MAHVETLSKRQIAKREETLDELADIHGQIFALEAKIEEEDGYSSDDADGATGYYRTFGRRSTACEQKLTRLRLEEDRLSAILTGLDVMAVTSCRYLGTAKGCTDDDCLYSHVQHESSAVVVKPCHFYNTERGCKNGAACQFAHIEPATKRVKCRFFGTSSGCKNGTACQFAHIELAPERVKCRFVGTFRGCKNGDGCQFKH